MHGRGYAVAEAAVNGCFRRPKNGQWLAAFAKLVELVAHEPGRDALSPMRWEDGHPRHAGRGKLTAWDRQRELVRRRHPHELPVVDGNVDPIDRHGLVCPFDVALLDLFAERHHDRSEGFDELVFVSRLAELDSH